MRARRVTALLTSLVVLATAGCGEGGDDVVEPTTTSSDPTASTDPTTSVPLTTPFTFAPRDTTPFAAGDGTFTIAGDQQATGQFSSTACPGIKVTPERGIQASLVFVSNVGLGSARRWVLDLAGMRPGETQFPEPGGFNQIPPRRVRLSVQALGQVLTWGTNAAGQGTVTGTLTASAPDAKSGSFELELGFSGSEGNTVPLTSHGPVQIKGDWECPNNTGRS
ncbi:MAG: hypothetical protein M3314_13855 [Actinomycetota bacterium]|nr:hypothetical protein [Actinomycetota bacterium]